MLFLPVGKNSLTKMLIRFRGAPTYKTHVNKTEKEKGLAGTLHIKLDAYLPNAIPTDNLIFFSKKNTATISSVHEFFKIIYFISKKH